MPFAQADGAEIYYEVHPAQSEASSPDKTPLLMIMGLGLNSLSWYKNLPGLSASRTIIIFDNRGTGRSAKPDRMYSIKQMANDAVAVLDAAGVRRAHVFGYSMGSLIAQEIALNYPHRVKSLILGASTPGGAYGLVPSFQTGLRMAMSGTANWQQAMELIIPILYSEEFIREHPEEVAADTRIQLIYPTPGYAYHRQLEAITRHDTYNRLYRLAMPALVFAGDKDRMVVPENSKNLARQIPRAELVIVPGRGHFLPSEDPELTNRLILNFLDKV